MLKIVLFCLVLVLGLAALNPPVVRAAEWTADCNGGGDCLGIQECIDLAADGDTITVKPCTYFETLDFSGKDLLVTSQGEAYRDTTIIDGEGQRRSVEFASGESSAAELRYFTFENGAGRNEGGCVYLNRSSATLRGNLFYNCVPYAGEGDGYATGGAVYINESIGFVLEDNGFLSNSCSPLTSYPPWTMGGAVAVYGTDAELSTGVIRGNTFLANQVQAESGGHGGAIASRRS